MIHVSVFYKDPRALKIMNLKSSNNLVNKIHASRWTRLKNCYILQYKYMYIYILSTEILFHVLTE